MSLPQILTSAANPQSYKAYLNGTPEDGTLPNLGWNYPLDMQNLINRHWRSFIAPHTYQHGIFFAIFCILLCSSVFGNGLVLWIFGTSKTLRTPSNLLIMNLAVFDLTMCCNMPHFLANTIVGYIVGGDFGCDMFAMLGGVSGMGAAISNAFIAYDRYRTISNPIDGRLTYGQVGGLIALSWIWTVPFSILPFFRIWGFYTPEGFLTSCSFDYLTPASEIRQFVIAIFVWSYVIPMIIICTYYAKLFLHVRRHEKMLAEQAKKMNIKSLSANADSAAMSVELRIAKAAMTIYFLFLVAWTPYSIINFMGLLEFYEQITPFVSLIPGVCAKSVSCLDPWVYAASHPKYRLELEKRLPWLGIREKNVTTGSATGSVGNNDDSSTIVVD